MADPGLRTSLFSMLDASLVAGALVALGAWGGTWLDGKFHTQPWLTLCLAVLGGVLGMTRMIMKALALNAAQSTPTIAKSADKGESASASGVDDKQSSE